MTDLLTCTGSALGSGLLVGPCQFCLRRADRGDMLPAVHWVESPDLAGYQCANQVKTPKARHKGEVVANLLDACIPQLIG